MRGYLWTIVISATPEVCLSLRRKDGAGEEALRQTISRVAVRMAHVSIAVIPDGSKEREQLIEFECDYD